MAKATDPGQAFLEAFTQYIDFRLTEVGGPKPVGRRLARFVPLFERFLKSRGGNPRNRAFKRLATKMSQMKGSRGGGSIKPRI